VSIGIASGARASSDELIRDADLALYAAKAAGRDRYTTFRSSMQLVADERLGLEMDLREAIAREELFLLYQPIFDLESEHVTGAEALIRWQHPTRGTLSAAEFIPVAEQSGLIVPIGRWVLAEASTQAARWRQAGHEIDVAVNVSARQLESEHLISDVNEALQDSGLQAAALTLELTETTIMVDAAAPPFCWAG